MLGDANDFNNIETRVVIEFFFSCTSKTGVVQFKRGEFFTCDAPRPRRPKTLTTPEITDQFHELI